MTNKYFIFGILLFFCAEVFAGGDPFSPSSCQGPQITKQQVLGYYKPGDATATFGQWAAYSRRRNCTAQTGCSPWMTQSSASLLSMCYGGVQQWQSLTQGSFFSFVWSRGTNLYMLFSPKSVEYSAQLKVWDDSQPDLNQPPRITFGNPHQELGCSPVGEVTEFSATTSCSRLLLHQKFNQRNDGTIWEENEVVLLGTY